MQFYRHHDGNSHEKHAEPNATPTKPGQLQEKEVNHFKDEVWSKVFALMDENILLCLEEDMEDGFNMSGI
jgi:hypothetical protein